MVVHASVTGQAHTPTHTLSHVTANHTLPHITHYRTSHITAHQCHAMRHPRLISMSLQRVRVDYRATARQEECKNGTSWGAFMWLFDMAKTFWLKFVSTTINAA